jgi:integrating conjugative element protein (TIGR03757 family)
MKQLIVKDHYKIMNNHQNSTHHLISDFIKTYRSFAMTGFNKTTYFVTISIALFLLSSVVHANNISNTNNANYRNNTNNANNTNNTNEVWIFSTKEHVFTQAYKLSNNWTIKHYLIDGGRDFESKISQGLSKNRRTAQKQIRQRFNKYKKSWVAQAKSAWQGAINAQSLNIEKVPAITFDKGKTLIYGVTDLSKALNIHRKEKTKQTK